ncbi:1,4-dihydroxy-2-naphthoate polyprenyltransferase [bacterium]|nr:1,4-dihydroxy-2-naphthoate polyprenyltransferase [bacterium]
MDSLYHAWMLAIRPKTLAAAIAPVLLGVAAAKVEGEITPLLALCAMLGAVLIQIGTNLANDYADFKSGADTHERLGPTRVTQTGLLKPNQVKWGANIAFALAVCAGIPLIMEGGWPILVIGLTGILFGWLYTSGPYPLGYNGLGEIFVFLYFGFAGVMGTCYVLAGKWTLQSAVLSLVPACHASAILAINNLRDIHTDRPAGKRTLAVRFGEKFARGETFVLLVAPFLIPLLLTLLFESGMGVFLCWAAVPLAISPLKLSLRATGKELNLALGETARLRIVFAALLSAGLLI